VPQVPQEHRDGAGDVRQCARPVRDHRAAEQLHGGHVHQGQDGGGAEQGQRCIYIFEK